MMHFSAFLAIVFLLGLAGAINCGEFQVRKLRKDLDKHPEKLFLQEGEPSD